VTDEQDALKIANDSGFPLQIAVGHQISQSTGTNGGWRVAYAEHAWSNVQDQQSGFIDLVLADKDRSTFLVVECKRVRDSTWVFMHKTGRTNNRRHAKAWITCAINDGLQHFGWDDAPLDPGSPEASFCAVRGQSAGERSTMLERIGGELVSATEAFASEQRNFRPQGDSIRFYFNVIVTTATLKIAAFDPTNISLAGGEIQNASITDVPYLRFRKQLSARGSLPTVEQYVNHHDLAYAQEQTIFVVHAEALHDFLVQFEVPDDVVRRFRFNNGAQA
jgi:hypothetical protein